MTESEQNFAYHVGRTVGKYKLASLTGRGGMAEVYKSTHPDLGRDLAIKILHPFHTEASDFVARFRREARAAAALRHPNIVQIYDFDATDDGLYYMVMEHIPGDTLEGYLERVGLPLSAAEALPIFTQIADALHYAHAKGTVHRDIKPANIMIDGDGHVYLTDFGIAQIVGQSRLTQSGMATGTPAYMSPEQVTGEKITAAADIYALGVILYVMLTGKFPHAGDSAVTVMMNKVSELPVPPREHVPEMSQVVETVVLTALAQQPDHRYADTMAMAEALQQAIADGDGTPSLPKSMPRSRSPEMTLEASALQQDTAAGKTAVSPPPTSTPPWIWAVIAIGAMALIAVGFLLARGGQSLPATAVTGTAGATSTADDAAQVPATPISEPAELQVPGMTFIPGNSFVMGNETGNLDEQPEHEVTLDSFFIDTTEITNAAFAEFVAETGAAAPVHWRQPDPSLWEVTATEPYIVGSFDNRFSYDGSGVLPAPGTLTMSVDADADEGLVVATFNGRVVATSDETDIYSGAFRIEQTRFFDGPPFPPFKEGGLADYVAMHGLSGNELSQYPELLAYIGTWGQADLYLDEELLFENLGIHIMYSDGVRDDETHFIRRADGTCCFSPDDPGDGFVDPEEQEISIWLFSASTYGSVQNFWMNVYYNDVTVLEAPAFAGPATYASGTAELPVTNVSWEDAAAFCSWREARLPTEAEWEYAARSDDSENIYPWGSDKGAVRVNIDGIEDAPVAVGSFPQSASPFGVQDMAGNVWEWTADWYAPDYYAGSVTNNPTGPASGDQKVLRGGGFRVVDFLGLDEARATHRRPLGPDQTADDIGFRCAMDE